MSQVMFSFVTRSKSNFLSIADTQGFVGSSKTSREVSLESRLARKGLMIGLSMEHGAIKVYLVGKLNGATGPLLKELLKTFLNNSYKSFVFDLSGLETLDSTGVATLVWARNLALEAGGYASVTNP